MQERRDADKVPGAVHRVAVTQCLRLLDKPQPRGVVAGGRGVGRRLAGADDDTDLLDAGLERLLDDDLQDRLLGAVAVDDALERQCALLTAGGRDNRPTDSHGSTSCWDTM